jgi:hypothetical protein
MIRFRLRGLLEGAKNAPCTPWILIGASSCATAVLFAWGLQQREWIRVRAVVSGGPFVTVASSSRRCATSVSSTARWG